jgi:hypothetical protein
MEVENKMGIVVPCLPRGFSFRLQPLYAFYLSLSSLQLSSSFRSAQCLSSSLSGEISGIGECDLCGRCCVTSGLSMVHAGSAVRRDGRAKTAVECSLSATVKVTSDLPATRRCMEMVVCFEDWTNHQGLTD